MFHGQFFFDEYYLSKKIWQLCCVHTQQRLSILLGSLTLVTDICQRNFATEQNLHEYIFSATNVLSQGNIVCGNEASHVQINLCSNSIRLAYILIGILVHEVANKYI